MCCLGQFALQLADVKECAIKGCAGPEKVGVYIPALVIFNDHWRMLEDSKLSYEAIEINDNANTTVTEKIEKLKELFGDHGYEINVINQKKVTT